MTDSFCHQGFFELAKACLQEHGLHDRVFSCDSIPPPSLLRLLQILTHNQSLRGVVEHGCGFRGFGVAYAQIVS